MSEMIYAVSDIGMKDSPFDKITDLRVIKQVNEHGKLSISGIVPEKKMDQYIEQIDENETIEIYLTRDGGQLPLFYGIVTNVTVAAVRNVRTMTIEASSMTFLMDVKKDSRSFQNSQQRYSDVIAKVTESFPGAAVIDHVSKGASIGGLIVQYQETAWTFIKRLASHFHMPLIPVTNLPGVKYYAGLPDAGQPIQLKEHNYTIKNNMKEYIQIRENNRGLNTDSSSFSFEVVSNKILELGCPVIFRGVECYVYHTEIGLEKGVLLNKYELRSRGGFHCNKLYNPLLVGSSLFGKITAVAKDKVKLHLNIDRDQHAAQTWFPYSTVYSSPDGSGWYCMPEIGDEVRLYFPDEEEKNAFAASSVDLDSSDSTKRSDPAVKSISTKYGKQIVFQPGAVEIIGNGQTLLRLTDDGGIEVKSNKKITISAQEDIEITGGAKVLIQGEEGVDIKQAGTMLTIQEDVALTGAKVNIQ